MSTVALFKEVSALPGTLVADAVYAVRTGSGFDLYIADNTGTVAHKVNTKDSVALVNPVPIYTSGDLTRIDYDGGHYLVLTYTGGNVTKTNLHIGATNYQKTLSYDLNDNWTGTVEGYI